MSLATAARHAKNIGYISWAFEKTIKMVRVIGRKGYEIIVDFEFFYCFEIPDMVDV